MQIAMSKTREQFPLSPKKIIKKTIRGMIFKMINLFFVALIAVILWAKLAQVGIGITFLPAITPAVIFIGIVLAFLYVFVVPYVYQQWYFATYFYDLTSDHIVIRKGPIAPREITIPYERVQDVYVDQDLWDRILGIYDVHLASAAVSSGMEAHIDGVEKAGADGLRAILLATMKQKIDKGAVAPLA